jgi:hypothetical protein
MKKFAFIFTIIGGVILSSPAQDNMKSFFKQADDFMDQYVHKHRVQYSQIQQNPDDLQSLIDFVQHAGLSGADINTKKAFWLNALNLTVIDAVMDHYPIDNLDQVDGFYDKLTYTIAGQTKTINGFKESAFKEFNDPRVYFAISLGVEGSPPPPNFGFKPNQVESQLNEHLRDIFNKKNYIRINKSDNSVFIPVTFHHHKDALENVGQKPLQFINRYLKHHNLSADTEIQYYPLTGKLNGG